MTESSGQVGEELTLHQHIAELFNSQNDAFISREFHEEAIKHMLDSGVNPNNRDDTGSTALLAIFHKIERSSSTNIWYLQNLSSNGVEIIKLLVQHGADVNATNGNDYTFLSHVFSYDYSNYFFYSHLGLISTDCNGVPISLPKFIDLVMFLLDNGADLNIKTWSREQNDVNILDVCLDMNRFDIAELLVKYGAKYDDITKSKSPVSKYFVENLEMKKKINILEEQINVLQEQIEHLKYMPGGIGAKEAEEDFKATITQV